MSTQPRRRGGVANSYEVTVPVTVSVTDERGSLKVGGCTLDSWGGFFWEAEKALGVWDEDRQVWGCEEQWEIAEAAWSFVRGRMEAGDA